MTRFYEKVAVVTGASSGIGLAIAQAFLSEGARVMHVGRSLQRLPPSADNSRSYSCDITLPDGPAAVVDVAMREFGRIDILVNAAGILTFGRCDTADRHDWKRTLDVNLTAPFRITQAAVPYLRETRGCVVNVSSINSNRPFANTLAYSASKAGLDQLTRVTAVELAEFGIRVNAVNPGVVVTGLHLTAGMPEKNYGDFLERGKATHPLGRVGSAWDVSDAVLFLASEGARWITGVTLPVDGGRHLTVVR